nr:rhodopsin, GQ-coupled-like [Lytechinus pictus]
MSVSGMFGNVCSLIAVAKSPVLRRHNNVFLISMTCMDILVTGLVEPLIMVQTYYETWPFNHASCKAFNYILVLFSGNSLTTVTFLTLQRFVKITKSAALYEKVFGGYKVYFYFIQVWVIGIILTIMPEFGFGRISYIPIFSLCSWDPEDFHSWLYMAVLMSVAGLYLIPVPAAYYLIFKKVRDSRKQMQHWGQDGSLPANNNSDPALSKNELRITKISLLVTIAVMVTWLPVCISHILQIVVPSAVYAYRPLQLLLFANSTINPFLYAWMNRHYRSAYQSILSVCFKNNRVVGLDNNSTAVNTIHLNPTNANS